MKHMKLASSLVLLGMLSFSILSTSVAADVPPGFNGYLVDAGENRSGPSGNFFEDVGRVRLTLLFKSNESTGLYLILVLRCSADGCNTTQTPVNISITDVNQTHVAELDSPGGYDVNFSSTLDKTAWVYFYISDEIIGPAPLIAGYSVPLFIGIAMASALVVAARIKRRQPVKT